MSFVYHASSFIITCGVAVAVAVVAAVAVAGERKAATRRHVRITRQVFQTIRGSDGLGLGLGLCCVLDASWEGRGEFVMVNAWHC